MPEEKRANATLPSAYLVMKKLDRDPRAFDIHRLLEAAGLDLETGDFAIVGDAVVSYVQKLKAHTARIHGLHVQATFAYVASCLGECALVKDEDSGDIFTSEEILAPDYRLVLKSGKQLLVEVKNHHPSDPMKSFFLKTDYVDRLSGYARLVGAEVRFAIYWSRWSLWTLLPISAFSRITGKLVITFGSAMKANEMSELGDLIVATTPPLILRRIADRLKPRTIGSDGRGGFIVAAVEIWCAGTQVKDQAEKDIAFFLMLFGGWTPSDEIVELEGDLIQWVDVAFNPTNGDEPSEPSSSFPPFLGPISTMLSRRFQWMTASDGSVRTFTVVPDADLKPPIPRPYDPRDLPLWFLQQRQSFDHPEPS